MTFLYPLGLLGLIGIPILIIIYIIKNKYTEQTVSSTYLWTLSERFLKRRNPINKIAGLISLILQILVVLLLSFGIAHPVFTLPGMANNYCIILDCSGSMLISQDGTTRFDIAKDRISDILDEAVGGSTFTLVCVGESTTVYDGTTDKERVRSLLDQTQPVYSSVSLDRANEAAQCIFDGDSSTITYLVTDKAYNNISNVNLINVSAGEQNYALHDVTYDVSENLTVSGYVTSYESDVALTVMLTVYSGEESVEYQVSVAADRLEDASFSFECETRTFDYLTVEILQSDALALDNSVTIYSVDAENSYKALIVANEPYFMHAILAATNKAEVDILSVEEYSDIYMQDGMAATAPSGYGLYIFQDFNPQVLPSDGTVWLFGLDSSLSDANFSVQGNIVLDREDTDNLEFSTSKSSTVRNLVGNLLSQTNYPIYIKTYIKCSPYRAYTTLATINNNPVIFTTQTAHGNREVVFAFSLSEADFSMSPNFPILISNLLDYSFPAAVEDTLYACGETAVINVPVNTTSIRVVSPSGDQTFPDTTLSTAEFVLDEVGEYTITITIGGNAGTYRLYSAFPVDESATSVTSNESFLLNGEQTYDGSDGIYDDLAIIFALVAIILLADWVVYCYEQYQLR